MNPLDTDTVVDLDTADDTASTTASTTSSTRPTVDVDDDDDKILPRGCELNGDGSVTVKFTYPVSITIKANGATRSEDYDRLTFHRLRGADLAAMRSTAPEHQTLVLLSRSARIRHPIMAALYAKMDGADIARCDKVLGTFLG